RPCFPGFRAFLRRLSGSPVPSRWQGSPPDRRARWDSPPEAWPVLRFRSAPSPAEASLHCLTIDPEPIGTMSALPRSNLECTRTTTGFHTAAILLPISYPSPGTMPGRHAGCHAHSPADRTRWVDLVLAYV